MLFMENKHFYFFLFNEFVFFLISLATTLWNRHKESGICALFLMLRGKNSVFFKYDISCKVFINDLIVLMNFFIPSLLEVFTIRGVELYQINFLCSF